MSGEVITDRDWEELDAAKFLFYHVREFVARRFPKMRKVSLGGFCEEILRYRQAHSDDLRGRRAFMHVAHLPACVCAWFPAVRKLRPEHQVGLYLHEFGHLGSRGGDDAADRWVGRNFGIHICYTGELALEWVSPKDALRVLEATPKWVRPARRRRR